MTNRGVGAILNGNFYTGSGTNSLVSDGTNPSFIVTNGTLTLSASTTFSVTKSGGVLPLGVYKIISKATSGNTGSVGGTLPSVILINGASQGSLGIVDGELYLTNGSSSTFNYTGSSFTYNGSAQTPLIAFSGSTGPKTTNYVGVSVSYGPTANTPVNAGTYYVLNTVAADANYFGATNMQTFTISAKTASVTANPQVKAYGEVNPSLTAVTNGTVNGDTINVTLTTDATQFSSVCVSNIIVVAGSNPNYIVLTTNSTLTINPAGTTLALVSDNNPALPGSNVTFTATVSSGAGTPTGSVIFKDGISPLGTGVLNSSAQAALSTTLLAPGNHTITAEYAGGGNFSGSTNSPALTQGVNNPPVLSLVTLVGGLQLSWEAPGYILQQAAGCIGPWTDLVPPPVSPLVITPTNPATYYRLLWSAP